MFMSSLRETLNNEISVTENGAIGFKTSGKKLLDLNFAVSSLRNCSEQEIINKFMDAYYEDKLLAVKWLFFASDVREGLGERRLFRTCLLWLTENNPNAVMEVLDIIPEYNRWDNLLVLLDTELRTEVVALFTRQLDKDLTNMNNGEAISLLAKWLPSLNTSSAETRRKADIVRRGLGCTPREYRKMLSKLRAYLNVVEVKMSAKEWSDINYEAVPSRANLIYNGAFLRNDEDRRRQYLASLEKGEAKINAGVLFPHDIVHKYCGSGWSRSVGSKDVTLEELWKALPDYVNGTGNTICVADGSGSMTTTVGNTGVRALDVANALAIYFAERCSGQFKDNYITFSEHPQLVDFSKAKTLREKLLIAHKHDEVANTNIEAVFDLILTTAISKNMSQDELPQNILILSDMEFDGAVCTNKVIGNGWSKRYAAPTNSLFTQFANKYAEHGYTLPRLVFWNIASRTNTIPVRENELGVALVSGFSPAIAKMVLSNSTDPLECLLEQVNSERYQLVEDRIKDVI